jgi:hypothetical protein
MQFTQNDLLLIEQYKDLPKKHCKECENELPLNEVFFLREKRIKDGFENKCRKCRGGNYLSKGGREGKALINKDILNSYSSVFEIYDHLIRYNEMPFNSFVLDNHMEIFKYILQKENISINSLNELNRKWFQDRKLYSSLLRIYNGSIFQFVNAAYPDLFKPWDFITVGRKYWQSKENRIEAVKWLVNQLLKDKVINTIDEIPRKVNAVTFKEYGLFYMLDYYEHLYYVFNEVYPNKFYEWQYMYLPEGYINDKNNRTKCLKELVELYLKLDINNIPKVFSYEYFNRFHDNAYGFIFKTILDSYYDNLYDYVNEVYPNVFNKKDFPYKNHYITLDNIKVRSEPERMLHHLFMNLKLNYKYGDSVGMININGVNVLPDWYIYNSDKIVLVEYYGMLDMNGVDFGYKDKYAQKEQLYRQLCDDNNKYEYLPLHIDDMYNNYKGVRDKLNEYGII